MFDPFSSEADAPAASAGTVRVYAVSELTRRIKTMLEDEFPYVRVRGEISNLRQPRSGHLYFTLKDDRAQLTAVMFKSRLRGLDAPLEDGQLVEATGALSVYEPQGQYQLIVERIQRAGQGALQEAFERLKKKLAAEGLFEAARKRPLPVLPRHIGLVTSPTGAAIRDLLNVLTRRFPNLHIVLAPVKVQGAGAAQEIAEALDLLNRLGQVEVIVLGRGGGSIEDLWCFNEEVVARALARSAVPTISAVGHETDFTISDFVADLRAPTPSAAAELVVGRKEAFEQALQDRARLLMRLMRHRLLEARHRLMQRASHPAFQEPGFLVRQYRERLNGMRPRLHRASLRQVQDAHQRLDDHSLRLARAVETRLREGHQNLRRLSAQLGALNPLSILERGYSVTRDPTGRILRDAEGLAAGDPIVTQLAHGTLRSTLCKNQNAMNDAPPDERNKP